MAREHIQTHTTHACGHTQTHTYANPHHAHTCEHKHIHTLTSTHMHERIPTHTDTEVHMIKNKNKSLENVSRAHCRCRRSQDSAFVTGSPPALIGGCLQRAVQAALRPAPSRAQSSKEQAPKGGCVFKDSVSYWPELSSIFPFGLRLCIFRGGCSSKICHCSTKRKRRGLGI